MNPSCPEGTPPEDEISAEEEERMLADAEACAQAGMASAGVEYGLCCSLFFVVLIIAVSLIFK
jgi:hypothetical protein